MFTRPQLLELINRTRDDMLSRFPTDDTLRRSDAEVYARVEAGGFNELYGYLDWLARQLIYDTADGDMLKRWAAIWGLTQKQAVAASGVVAVTGLAGAILPAGAIYQSADQTQYIVRNDVTLVAGVGNATVDAAIPGAAANRAAGQTLTLTGPVTGIDATGINGLLSGGADIESDDDLRSRFLVRIRKPPQGGASYDYVGWALEVSGFTRAWCYAQEMGPGTVTVRGMCDNSYSDGIPQLADLAALLDHLNLRRPVTATVYAPAPIATTLNFTIHGLLPNTSALKASIETALRDVISRESSPGGTLLWSHLNSAIANAGEVYDYTLVSPSSDITHTLGHIPTMGTITWT